MNCEPCNSLEITCNHNVTIKYLKDLVATIPSGCCTTITVTGNDNYCPTYGELTSGALIPNFSDGGNNAWSNNVDGIVVSGNYSNNQCVAKKDVKLIYTAFESLIVNNSSPEVSECGGSTTTTRTLKFRKYTNECGSEVTSVTGTDTTLSVTWSGTDSSSVGKKTYSRNISFSDKHISSVSCSISWRGCTYTSNSVDVWQALRKFDHYNDYSKCSGDSLDVYCYPSSFDCRGGKSVATATYYYTTWTERHSIDTCGYDYGQENINKASTNRDVSSSLNATSHTYNCGAATCENSKFTFTATYTDPSSCNISGSFTDSDTCCMVCSGCDPCPPPSYTSYTDVTASCEDLSATVNGIIHNFSGGEINSEGHCVNYTETTTPTSYTVTWTCDEGGWVDTHVYVTGSPCCVSCDSFTVSALGDVRYTHDNLGETAVATITSSEGATLFDDFIVTGNGGSSFTNLRTSINGTVMTIYVTLNSCTTDEEYHIKATVNGNNCNIISLYRICPCATDNCIQTMSGLDYPLYIRACYEDCWVTLSNGQTVRKRAYTGDAIYLSPDDIYDDVGCTIPLTSGNLAEPVNDVLVFDLGNGRYSTDWNDYTGWYRDLGYGIHAIYYNGMLVYISDYPNTDNYDHVVQLVVYTKGTKTLSGGPWDGKLSCTASTTTIIHAKNGYGYKKSGPYDPDKGEKTYEYYALGYTCDGCVEPPVASCTGGSTSGGLTVPAAASSTKQQIGSWSKSPASCSNSWTVDTSRSVTASNGTFIDTSSIEFRSDGSIWGIVNSTNTNTFARSCQIPTKLGSIADYFTVNQAAGSTPTILCSSGVVNATGTCVPAVASSTRLTIGTWNKTPSNCTDSWQIINPSAAFFLSNITFDNDGYIRAVVSSNNTTQYVRGISLQARLGSYTTGLGPINQCAGPTCEADTNVTYSITTTSLSNASGVNVVIGYIHYDCINFDINKLSASINGGSWITSIFFPSASSGSVPIVIHYSANTTGKQRTIEIAIDYDSSTIGGWFTITQQA